MEKQAKTMSFLDSAKPALKDLIIGLLGEEWPLTARQIHLRIRNQTAAPMTYQGVHKAVRQLEESGVLTCKDHKYAVNLEWLKGIRAFSELVQKKYLSNISQESSPEKMNFVFETVSEADEFLLDVLLSFDIPEGTPIYLSWNHLWIPLFIRRSTYKKFTEMLLKMRFYGVSPSDTPIDRWCASFWQKKGIREKLGVKLSQESSFAILGDTVIQVFYPLEIRTQLDRAFTKAKTIHELDLDKLFEEVFEKKTKIPLVVSKNPALAEYFKGQIKRAFEDPE
ncbi:Uncharacterised protein [Candidatus Burarchaeum australiense]|nr:Uncharacterised protein [Candidatus Burarchaeum australiense]